MRLHMRSGDCNRKGAEIGAEVSSRHFIGKFEYRVKSYLLMGRVTACIIYGYVI